MSLFLLGGVLLLFVIACVVVYNKLIRRRNMVDQAFSTIEVQLTQRYDLIPKLVETVKQYMGHERSLLERRSCGCGRRRSGPPRRRRRRSRADNQLTRAMGQLNVTMETTHSCGRARTSCTSSGR